LATEPEGPASAPFLAALLSMKNIFQIVVAQANQVAVVEVNETVAWAPLLFTRQVRQQDGP